MRYLQPGGPCYYFSLILITDLNEMKKMVILEGDISGSANSFSDGRFLPGVFNVRRIQGKPGHRGKRGKEKRELL